MQNSFNIQNKKYDDIKSLSKEELRILCQDIREFLVEKVSKSGGHLASNLGTVEMTVALHRVLNPYVDRIVFDVGHQCYTHKILTGRADGFDKLRKLDGLSGFPKPKESPADSFIAGHASSSVSVALGMAKARTRLKEPYNVVAVIGDGALTGGLAYEGIANAGLSGEPIVVILNDNGMSIGGNVGSVAHVLSQMRIKTGYHRLKKVYWETVGKIGPLYRTLHRVKERAKKTLLPGNIFDDLGFYYLGPIDGHDIEKLETSIKWAIDLKKPVLLHVKTTKGKGYLPAETKPDLYHGVGAFDPAIGITEVKKENFSTVFADTLCKLADNNSRICAITAAMVDGTGLSEFEKRFPTRLIDSGIAEGHSISMAAGMAKQGLLPVVAIYSSFLQRAYDMLIQDIGLKALNVILCVDRAGLVGEDGETHNGVYDVCFLKSVPNMTVWSPASYAELQNYLTTAVKDANAPVAIRYPRGAQEEYESLSSGTSEIIKNGNDITIITYGVMTNEAIKAAELLSKSGVRAELIKLNRIFPLDTNLVFESVAKTGKYIVAEDVCNTGCVGLDVSHVLSEIPGIKGRLLNLGDGVVREGSVRELRKLCKLDSESIAKAALELCNG